MAILNITNFDDHPEDPQWIVFRFKQRGIAKEFVDGLTAVSIPYEQDEGDGAPFLVGVKAHHRETAVRLNYTVLGRHRTPFIADGLVRWSIIGLFAALLLLAVLGMIFGK